MRPVRVGYRATRSLITWFTQSAFEAGHGGGKKITEHLPHTESQRIGFIALAALKAHRRDTSLIDKEIKEALDLLDKNVPMRSLIPLLFPSGYFTSEDGAQTASLKSLVPIPKAQFTPIDAFKHDRENLTKAVRQMIQSLQYYQPELRARIAYEAAVLFNRMAVYYISQKCVKLGQNEWVYHRVSDSMKLHWLENMKVMEELLSSNADALAKNPASPKPKWRTDMPLETLRFLALNGMIVDRWEELKRDPGTRSEAVSNLFAGKGFDPSQSVAWPVPAFAAHVPGKVISALSGNGTDGIWKVLALLSSAVKEARFLCWFYANQIVEDGANKTVFFFEIKGEDATMVIPLHPKGDGLAVWHTSMLPVLMNDELITQTRNLLKKTEKASGLDSKEFLETLAFGKISKNIKAIID